MTVLRRSAWTAAASPSTRIAQPDNGIAARLNATVGAGALPHRARPPAQIRPVGFGVMSMTELVERIAALAQDAAASARQP